MGVSTCLTCTPLEEFLTICHVPRARHAPHSNSPSPWERKIRGQLKIFRLKKFVAPNLVGLSPWYGYKSGIHHHKSNTEASKHKT